MVTSALKMETVLFSETLASASQSTRRPNPEEHHKYILLFTKRFNCVFAYLLGFVGYLLILKICY
jgi:hypothetical protein